MRKKKLSWKWSILSLFCIGASFRFLFLIFYRLDYDWEFKYLIPFFWQEGKPGLILQGLWGTIWISFSSIIFGSVLGIVCGSALLSKEPILRCFAQLFVDVFRNTPLLVQLYVMYFVVGTALEWSAETSGLVSLSLFCSGYVSEIFRGTVAQLDEGQLDAAKALGLNRFQLTRYVAGPQALRRMLPALVGQFVSLVKDSSLVSVISLVDLTKSAVNIVAISFKSFETWFVIALIYFVLNFTFSFFGRILERKLSLSYKET